MTHTPDEPFDLVSVTRAVFEILRGQPPAPTSTEGAAPSLAQAPASAPTPAPGSTLPAAALPVTPVPVTPVPVTPVPVTPVPVTPVPGPRTPGVPSPAAAPGASSAAQPATRSGQAAAILDEIAFLDE